ncbi:MAG TPA: class I SAM-dependent methyltransferase [Gaiellaceae bacterium]|nr:class I SAM-dependent methyltransferase [Gaiellaceae bacterium]
MRQDDADAVRREYADESGLSARISIWARRTGPRAQDVAFDEAMAARPGTALEVGCGRGELAERLLHAGVDVVALDQSERMVELTRARGVDARVGDVVDLPFADGAFDLAVANFMLYHVRELDRALAELARVLRPGGTLIAATNGFDQLKELWELIGRDLSERHDLFMRETGAERLARHFARVRMIDLPASVDLTADEMRYYVAHSVRHRQLADRVPQFEGTRTVTASTAVFVANT